jgi:hypothetical protein
MVITSLNQAARHTEEAASREAKEQATVSKGAQNPLRERTQVDNNLTLDHPPLPPPSQAAKEAKQGLTVAPFMAALNTPQGEELRI